MAEIRRNTAAIDSFEKVVSELANLALDATLSEDLRAKFSEAQKQVGELGPVVDKMRQRCEARAELEDIKAQLRSKLPGSPENVLAVAHELLNPPMDCTEGGEAPEARVELAPGDVESVNRLVQRAEALEVVATYGVKMVEKVSLLIGRFDASSTSFTMQVIPRFGGAVAEADAAEAARRAEAEREALALAAEEARLAEEEQRRVVDKLMAESEQKRQEQFEAEEALRKQAEMEAEEKRAAEAALAAEEEVIRKNLEDEEKRLTEVGPEQACAEALALMLSMPVGAYRAAIEALHSMLGGIAGEPEDASLRLIRIANDGFQQQLGRRPGVWLFLRGVGFEISMRENLPNGLVASLGMRGGPPTERFLWLKEPSMLDDYEAWVSWHDRIKTIARFLQDLERLVFQRTAHLGRHGLDSPAHGAISSTEVTRKWEARAGS